MNNLVMMENNQVVTSSLKVAEVFGKQHKHVLDTIENLVAENSAAKFFLKSTYVNRGKQYPMYLMNRDGFTLLAMGFTGQEALAWKLKYIEAFNQMESTIQNQLALPDFANPAEAARAWAEQYEHRQNAEKQLQAQAPKVLFADSVSASHTSILIGELAKLLKQNGVDIGATRLFQWLRDNGYLISRKGTDWNMPTQRAMNMGLFTIKETVISHSNGVTSISKTPKVTGKGQIYFVNKFLVDMQAVQ